MGSDVSVGGRENRIVCRGRLYAEHIRGVCGELSGLQCLSHRLLVHQRTAAGIDQYSAVLHLRECTPVDEMTCSLRQRAVEREDITGGQQAVERGFLDSSRQVGRISAGHGKHVHTEHPRDAGHLHADIAESYDAHRLARKLHQRRIPIAEVRALAPFPFPGL